MSATNKPHEERTDAVADPFVAVDAAFDAATQPGHAVGEASNQITTIDLSVNHRFGDYELLGELSRGGMGVVYRARELRLNRVVALKMILSGGLAGEEDVRRFHTEAEAAGQLGHPGIVPVYDVGSVGSQHYYTMSLIDGHGLDQFKGHGITEVTRAARIIQQIAEAVEHAHSHGIVHRDLKPANILLDRDGFPRITDFGLAKRIDESAGLTQTGQILGSPGYMAPEQAAGDSHLVGPLVDVYALGGLLYFVLTGRPPFQSSNAIDALVQSLARDPISPRTLNPSIPRPLEQICMRCLERMPTDRYASAGAVALDLECFLTGHPVLAQSPTVLERVRRFARRSPAFSMHLVALVMLLMVAQLRYMLADDVDPGLHLKIEAALLSWIAISAGLYFVEKVERLSKIAQTTQLCIDAVWLTIMLSLMSQPGSPPGPWLIGYPLIIVGGSMYFDARRVIVVTVAACLSYAGLIIAEPHLMYPIHHPVCFLIMLLAIAACLVHQVRRFTALSDYFESRH